MGILGKRRRNHDMESDDHFKEMLMTSNTLKRTPPDISKISQYAGPRKRLNLNKESSMSDLDREEKKESKITEMGMGMISATSANDSHVMMENVEIVDESQIQHGGLAKVHSTTNISVRKSSNSFSATPSPNQSYRAFIENVNSFLRLLITNHQRTVKKLSKNPEEKNPSRSFDTYLQHFKLVKRISEYIWDRPAPYSAEMIFESKVMNGLWKFVSYCEAYYEDCYLVKRAHLNLYLII